MYIRDTRAWGGLQYLLLGVLLLVGATPALATTYYAGPAGSDGNSCGAAQNIATPKRTIGNARGCLGPGDTLLIRGGTYPEALSDGFPSGSSWSAPVTFKAYPGETVIMQPTGPYRAYVIYMQNPSEHYIIFDSLIFDGFNKTIEAPAITGSPPCCANGAHHIRFINCEVRNMFANITIGHAGDVEFLGGSVHDNSNVATGNCGQGDHGCTAHHGFYIYDTQNVLIDGMDIYSLTGYGIQLYYAGLNTSPGIIIRNNRIHEAGLDGGECGIVVADTIGALIYNNLIYNNGNPSGLGGCGIANGHGSSAQGTLIYNNTVTGNKTGAPSGFSAIFTQSGSGHIIRNNIIWNNAGTDYAVIGGSATEDHNLIGTNPLFVNEAGHDYHLQAGSPASNAGVALGSVPTDLDGNARGTPPEIGAFEIGGVLPLAQTDPLVWLTFDAGAGLTAADSSTNNHPGTLQNGVTWVAGHVGPFAAQCDGVDDAILIPGLLGTPPALTLALWANVLTMPDPVNGSELVSLGDYVALRLDNAAVHPFYYIGGSWLAADYSAALVGTGWHHYVWVVNPAGASQQLYVDGVLRSSTSNAAPLVWTGQGTDTYLCRHGAASEHFLNGAVDQLKVSSHAWTQAEVTAEFLGLPPPPAPPLAWLSFDAGTGTVATDSSPNAHPGTLQNGVTWVPGRIGPFAVQCDGVDDAILIPGLLGTPPALTVALWANVLTIPDAIAGSELVSLGDYVALHLTATTVHPFYYSGGSTWLAADYNAALVGTGWHHYVWVVNPASASQQLYVDGVLRSSTTNASPVVWTGIGTDTYLCRHGNTTTTFLNGALDQLKVADHAWTQAEVTAEYAFGTVPRLRPASGFWLLAQ